MDNICITEKLVIYLSNRDMIKISINYVKDQLYDLFGNNMVIELERIFNNFFVLYISIPEKEYLRMKLVDGNELYGTFIEATIYHDTKSHILTNVTAYWGCV